MEHWLKVTLWTGACSVLTVIIFYILDRGFKFFNLRKGGSGGNQGSTPLRSSEQSIYLNYLTSKFRRGYSKLPQESAAMALTPYRSDNHEILVAVAETEENVSGICVFKNEMRFEYYTAEVPSWCKENIDEQQLSARSLLTAFDLWAETWSDSDSVDVLSMDRTLCILANSKGSRLERQLRKYSEKFNFETNFQWGENFIVNDVDDRELWTETVAMAKSIVRADSQEEIETLFEDYCLQDWARRRIEPENAFPHSGPILSEDSPNYGTDVDVVKDGFVDVADSELISL